MKSTRSFLISRTRLLNPLISMKRMALVLSPSHPLPLKRSLKLFLMFKMRPMRRNLRVILRIRRMTKRMMRRRVEVLALSSMSLLRSLVQKIRLCFIVSLVSKSVLSMLSICLLERVWRTPISTTDLSLISSLTTLRNPCFPTWLTEELMRIWHSSSWLILKTRSRGST